MNNSSNGVTKTSCRFQGPKQSGFTFTRKHDTFPELTITINKTRIKSSTSVKYLGLVKDQKLTWKKHTAEKQLKCKRKIFELRQISKLKMGRLLHGIIDPMLLYGVPVWVESTRFKWCQNSLRSVQQTMLMIIIRSFKTISTKAALILSNSLPIEIIAQKLATLWKLKHQTTNLQDPSSTVVNGILNCCSINPDLLDHPGSSFDQQIGRPILQPILTTAEMNVSIPITWTCVKSKIVAMKKNSGAMNGPLQI